MAIVLVEQYFDFAFGLADHIYAVTRGKVVYESKKFNIDKSKLRASVGVKSVQATSRQDQPDKAARTKISQTGTTHFHGGDYE